MPCPPLRTIGFLVNPVAGMGGRVGLKGTDGLYEEAVRRGAEPVARERAIHALRPLQETGIQFLTAGGEMGAEELAESGIRQYEEIYHLQGRTRAEDTLETCRRFLARGVDLILFCGGDGTARDIFSVVGDRIPLLGIPAGVKMYSAVFAANPAAVSEILSRFCEAEMRPSEIVDVDEEAYRRGVLATRIYGFARVPHLPHLSPPAKQVYEEVDEDRARKAIALFIQEILRDDTLYILGAGTTTEAIARQIGVEKTLLGIDAVKSGRLIARDADERTLLGLVEKEPRVRVIVSPIGAQGFVLGRGTQALSPRVIRAVGPEHFIVVATPQKLAQTRELYIDTGDPDLDRSFGSSLLVISGYRMGIRRALRQTEAGKH